MRRLGALGALAAVVGLVAPTPSAAAAAPSPPEVKLRAVARMSQATAMAVRPADGTLYVTEQAGELRAIRDGRLVSGAVLDLTRRVSSGGERGLLGIAFSPDGSKLYLDYTDSRGNTQIDEFTMNGTAVDPASRRPVLSVDQPQPNHNGGQLAFGPDGYLYIALGDGGSEGDQGPGHASGGNGQSLGTLLGKILRIDPRPSGTAPYTVPADNPFAGREGAQAAIWAYGLRNPWRFSFDKDTGDLWIGEVGGGAWEEIDRAPARSGRDAGRGDNFGWNRLEGDHRFAGAAPEGAVAPVYEYPHHGFAAVTGGYVYRGSKIPALRGMYIFADYYRGKLRALVRNGSRFKVRSLGVGAPELSSFGEDANGELYVLSQLRGLFRIEPG